MTMKWPSEINSILLILGIMIASEITPSMARDLILITYGKQEKKAEMVEKILTQKLKLPSVLIKRRWKSSPCEKERDTIVHICLDDFGQMKIPFYDRETLQESFAIFVQEDGGKVTEGEKK